MSVINTNLEALQNAITLGRNQDLKTRSLNRLSSGSKVATAADDPAGFGVSSKLSSQTQRLTAVSTNIQNAVSYTQAGETILRNVGNVLSRLNEIATLVGDPTKTTAEVASYQKEFQGLQNGLRITIGGTTAEIGGTADIPVPLGTFNDIALFGPSASGYQVALGDSVGQSMTIPATNLRTGATLNFIQQDATGAYGLSVWNATATNFSDALQQVADYRAQLGSAQERLDLASATIQTKTENMQSAISQISDVDVAAESTQLAKYNILVQAGTAMLAQANTSAESVLKLLQN